MAFVRRQDSRRVLLLAAVAVVFGAGIDYAECETQPISNAQAAHRAESVAPGTAVSTLTDVTAKTENESHAALIQSGLEVVANYLPPYIAPYTGTKNSGVRPNLFTLGKPEKPFFFVMPGMVENIVDELGNTLPASDLAGLQMWATSIDGDGEQVAATTFALRAQLPDGIWKPYEVRGFVTAVLGDGTEWVDLGNVDFKAGGQASQLGFQFKEVVWKGKVVHFTATSDPHAWVIRSEIVVGDPKGLLLTSTRVPWSPGLGVPSATDNPASESGFYLPSTVDEAPSQVHVKVQVVKNGHLVRVPFVFVAGTGEGELVQVQVDQLSAGLKLPRLPKYYTDVNLFGAAAPPLPDFGSNQNRKPMNPPSLPTVPTNLLASFARGDIPKPAAVPVPQEVAADAFSTAPATIPTPVPIVVPSEPLRNVEPSPATTATTEHAPPVTVSVVPIPSNPVEFAKPPVIQLAPSAPPTVEPTTAKPLVPASTSQTYRVDDKKDPGALPEAGR